MRDISLPVWLYENDDDDNNDDEKKEVFFVVIWCEKKKFGILGVIRFNSAWLVVYTNLKDFKLAPLSKMHPFIQIKKKNSKWKSLAFLKSGIKWKRPKICCCYCFFFVSSFRLKVKVGIDWCVLNFGAIAIVSVWVDCVAPHLSNTYRCFYSVIFCSSFFFIYIYIYSGQN